MKNITTPSFHFIGDWAVETGQGQVTSYPDQFTATPLTQQEIDEYRAWDGQSDLVQKGDTVMHNGVEWVSLINNNVWQPPVGWRQVANNPDWIQPTGAHDAYALGDTVTHNGQIWESQYDANVWEPGVFGWIQV